MTKHEKINEALDCIGFLLCMAILLFAAAYYPSTPGMHSESTYVEARHAVR